MSRRDFSGRKFIAAFCLAAPIFFLSYAWAYGHGQVCFQKNCFDVETAQTNEDLLRGLQFRRELKPGQGMLFIFPQSGVHHFWMKDTLIPLDIIWLDENRRVIYIAANCPPCRTIPCSTYGPEGESRYTFEIKAGLCAQLNIRIGDEAVFRFP